MQKLDWMKPLRLQKNEKPHRESATPDRKVVDRGEYRLLDQQFVIFEGWVARQVPSEETRLLQDPEEHQDNPDSEDRCKDEFVMLRQPVRQENVERVVPIGGVAGADIRQRTFSIIHQNHDSLQNHDSDCDPDRRVYPVINPGVDHVADHAHEERPDNRVGELDEKELLVVLQGILRSMNSECSSASARHLIQNFLSKVTVTFMHS